MKLSMIFALLAASALAAPVVEVYREPEPGRSPADSLQRRKEDNPTNYSSWGLEDRSESEEKQPWNWEIWAKEQRRTEEYAVAHEWGIEDRWIWIRVTCIVLFSRRAQKLRDELNCQHQKGRSVEMRAVTWCMHVCYQARALDNTLTHWHLERHRVGTMRLSFALVASMAAINTLALPVSERSEGTTADKFMAWGFEDKRGEGAVHEQKAAWTKEKRTDKALWGGTNWALEEKRDTHSGLKRSEEGSLLLRVCGWGVEDVGLDDTPESVQDGTDRLCPRLETSGSRLPSSPGVG
ncbi:hypothetical protein FB107DRAFT_249374 [Schizophyllum commune]